MQHRSEEKKQVLDRTASADWGVLYAEPVDLAKNMITIIDAHYHAAKNMVQAEYGKPAKRKITIIDAHDGPKYGDPAIGPPDSPTS
jgi:hypothetical protein